jgi:DNA-binding transcriptional MerR regulator
MSNPAERDRLSIGQFSRASLLSVKALRSYHERGMLVPAVVDRSTSYRYYSLAQLSDAAVIRRLRDLDLPLDDIETVLRARSPAVTKNVLTAHHDLMADRLAHTARIIDDLQRGLDEPGVLTPVHVIDVAPQNLLTLSAEVPRSKYAEFFDGAFDTLLGTLQGNGALNLVSGPVGATYPAVIDSDETEFVVAFVPVSDAELTRSAVRKHLADVEAVQVEHWPGSKMASATFRGSYEDIGAVYRLLGTWAAENGALAEGRVREVYLVGPETGPDTSQYITELQWPLRNPLDI